MSETARNNKGRRTSFELADINSTQAVNIEAGDAIQKQIYLATSNTQWEKILYFPPLSEEQSSIRRELLAEVVRRNKDNLAIHGSEYIDLFYSTK